MRSTKATQKEGGKEAIEAGTPRMAKTSIKAQAIAFGGFETCHIREGFLYVFDWDHCKGFDFKKIQSAACMLPRVFTVGISPQSQISVEGSDFG